MEADVVPCFDYRYFISVGQYLEGAKIFRKDGSGIINYPEQHQNNGAAKNTYTNHNFKKVVRILKRTANEMAAERVHREVASCLIESLVYNCSDVCLMAPTWTDRVAGTIAQIWGYTKDDNEPAEALRWCEVSGCKYLFDPSQSWNHKDARDFALQASSYLGFVWQ